MSDQVRTPPLCIHCKHFVPSTDPNQALWGKCGRTPIINPVDGSHQYEYAHVERFGGKPCGAWGEKFESAT